MATSVYFNNQGATREQILIEDMIIESIKNHGIDIYYIPRGSMTAPKTYVESNPDELFGDDPSRVFTKAYKIDMYMESFQDFDGNQEFFSKFGLEIQKSARVVVARRTFERFVPTAVRNLPKEGDLIYLPVQMKLMEVRFVEEEKNFFQAGKLAPYMYGLNIENFKYNGEIISTGIEEIDRIATDRAIAVEFSMKVGGTSTYSVNELVYQGASENAATAKAFVSDWNAVTRKLVLRNINGEFIGNTAIVGVKSGAQWTTIDGTPGNTMEDANSTYEDNMRIESEADNILDWTETNPFGMPNE